MSSVLLDIIRNVERSNSIVIKGIDKYKGRSKVIVLFIRYFTRYTGEKVAKVFCQF